MAIAGKARLFTLDLVQECYMRYICGCYGDTNIQFWEWKHRFGIFAFANNYMAANSVLMCFAYFMRLPLNSVICTL